MTERLRRNRFTQSCYFPVPLGSISGLPAESCEEIRANEGGQASSGEYWLNSIVSGKVVLVHCDMETGGQLPVFVIFSIR